MSLRIGYSSGFCPTKTVQTYHFHRDSSSLLSSLVVSVYYGNDFPHDQHPIDQLSIQLVLVHSRFEIKTKMKRMSKKKQQGRKDPKISVTVTATDIRRTITDYYLFHLFFLLTLKILRLRHFFLFCLLIKTHLLTVIPQTLIVHI